MKTKRTQIILPKNFGKIQEVKIMNSKFAKFMESKSTHKKTEPSPYQAMIDAGWLRNKITGEWYHPNDVKAFMEGVKQEKNRRKTKVIQRVKAWRYPCEPKPLEFDEIFLKVNDEASLTISKNALLGCGGCFCGKNCKPVKMVIKAEAIEKEETNVNNL